MNRSFRWVFPYLLLLATAPARADLNSRRNAVVEVVQKVSPAVVYVGTEQIVERRFRGDSDDFFENFLGPREQRQAVQGLGSGVIIDSSGLVVTNDHVIRGASSIHVGLADGRELPGEVIGSDADNDLAVIRIQSKTPLPFAKVGTSADLMIGETVIAIGSPFGLAKTVTVGVLSATGRSFKADNRVYNDFLQTDAAINPGNSGGPLLNVDGEVIGINTAIYASGHGIGFAIPADKFQRIVRELTQFGKVRRAWTGIQTQSLTARQAANLGWDKTYGAVIASVEPGGPGEKAGLQRGDIVAEVSGSRIVDAEDFEFRIRSYPALTSVPITLFRNGQLIQVSVTLVEFPRKQAESLAWDRLGVRVRAGGSTLAITSVRPGSAAARIGLEPGDVLLRLNNQPLDSLDAFREALIAARDAKSVLLLVRRGRAGYYVTLPF